MTEWAKVKASNEMLDTFVGSITTRDSVARLRALEAGFKRNIYALILSILRN